MTENPFIASVQSDDFAVEVLQRSDSIPVLVDFWADWCNPCKMLMPILDKLALEYEGKFRVAKVDTEAEQELAASHGIRSLPTVRMFRNGVAVDEFMGALPESGVREFVERHLPRAADDHLAHAVLVDAPCSGLGALGRRSDARWHISQEAITRLTGTQNALLEEALRILRPHGVLTYSVCTVTQEETCDVAQAFHERHQELKSVELQGRHWRTHCDGGLVLPHDHQTDGMAVFQWQREE